MQRLITESLPSRSSESNGERQVGKYKGAANVAATEVCRMSLSRYRRGDGKQAALKSFHQGHDISDFVYREPFWPQIPVTKSEIGSGPAL